MLTDQEVERIATLARLKLEPEEKERMKKDLSSILDYIGTLNAVDTSSVEPLYQTTGLVNATRTDEPRNDFPPSEKRDELLLKQAPATKDRFIKVPSVMKSK